MNIIEAYEAVRRGEKVERVWSDGHTMEVILSCGILIYNDDYGAVVPVLDVTISVGSFRIKPKKVKKWRWIMGTLDGKLDNLEITTHHYSEEDKERLGLLQKIDCTEIEEEVQVR